jgi:hypothetical protein
LRFAGATDIAAEDEPSHHSAMSPSPSSIIATAAGWRDELRWMLCDGCCIADAVVSASVFCVFLIMLLLLLVVVVLSNNVPTAAGVLC